MVKKEIPVNEHFLVPEHRKLTEEEKQAIFEKFSATEKNMPKISVKDPAIRVFDPKVGDLFEIRRNVLDDEGTYLYYRVAV
ncbi:MAG: DNA-directed RNA polymerase subunit H [Candidatus Aenigmarchaeota archaeon]|nr:DNA-directed RNA polymerase subunit H [Candidatus Aenigmarchaeota archaeon]